MPATAPQSFRQELYAGHLLVMQCGARAEQFLDRAGIPLRDPRADAEALRMAALTSRLMESVGRGITLAQSGRAPIAIPAGPKSAAAIPDRECIVFRDRRLTWAEVTERTRRLANALLTRGLGKVVEREPKTPARTGTNRRTTVRGHGGEHSDST